MDTDKGFTKVSLFVGFGFLVLCVVDDEFCMILE